MRPRAAFVGFVLASFLTLGRGDAQSPIIADLSSHLIAVTTGFTGADLLFFGAIEQPGDIVLVVRGPNTPVTVRRKSRIAGVWLNDTSVVFEGVPSFYAAAASDGFTERASPSLLRRLQFGLDNLRVESPGVVAQAAEPFRAALIRRRQAEALFPATIEPVSVLGNRLFRTTIRFPANVPTGTYLVEVFFIVDDDVMSAQTTPLSVSRLGLGAEIFSFAHDQAAIYGFAAVAMAMAAGWAAGFIFRKG